MLKSVFYPNKTNSFAWVNVLFLIFLVTIGKVEAYAVLFGYFFESIIIGLFNVVKMYLSYKHNDKKASIFFSIPFFIVHYGGFIAIQSIFLFGIVSIAGDVSFKEPFNVLANFQKVLEIEGVPIVLALLVGTQLMKFIFDFLVPKKYNQFKVNEIMFKPYFRIFIQQFTVILGSFFMVFSNGSIVAAVLLIIFRFIVDFIFIAIKEDSEILERIVDKLHDGKISKSEIRKQLLLFTE